MSLFGDVAAAIRKTPVGGMLESLYLSRLPIPELTTADRERGFQRIELKRASIRLRSVGEGPRTIVIVPDPPNTIEHYEELIDLLRDDARVVCFEVPGFGLSYPKTGTFGFGAAECTQLVLELLDRLKLRDVTLVMSCIGGYVGLMAARRSDTAIARLVLSQTPAQRYMVSWARRFDKLGLLGLPVVGQSIMFVLKKPATRFWYSAALPEGRDAAAYIEPALSALRRGGPYALASGIQAMRRLDLSELDGVKQETTIVWGHADRTHEPTDPRSLLELVPHARFVSFSGCGHFPDLEEPRRFADLVLGTP